MPGQLTLERERFGVLPGSLQVAGDEHAEPEEEVAGPTARVARNSVLAEPDRGVGAQAVDRQRRRRDGHSPARPCVLCDGTRLAIPDAAAHQLLVPLPRDDRPPDTPERCTATRAAARMWRRNGAAG